MENEERKFQFIVPLHQEKTRLDVFLIRNLEKFSRARIQKLIDDSYITVNGKKTKPSHAVRPEEIIDVCIPEPTPSEIIAEDIPLEILYEDEHLLVINKDANMVVHPAYGNMTGTLVNALLHHCGHLSGIGGVRRPGIVHRLDKGTSGLLVVAKDDFTHQQLSAQFSARTVEREYIAVVWGHFREKEGRIQSLISRSMADRTKMVFSKIRGKEAITNYRVIEEFPLTSSVSVRLETGRTHQIRVHLTARGHPVFGDRTYGGRSKQLKSLNQKDQQLALNLLRIITRQSLHAKTLGFIHPITRQELRFDSELPLDMRNLLRYLMRMKEGG